MVPIRQRYRYLLYIVAFNFTISLFNIIFISSNPPLEGDCYEYAGLARNFLHYGKLIQTHISGYFFTDQIVLPHPACNRATLWTFILVPFQYVFGQSIWTFVLPSQLAFLLLGPVTYVFASRLFSPKIAFAASIATVCHTRIFSLLSQEDPGQPDIFGTVLFLFTIFLFVKRRWLWAGIMTGVTFLTRINGLILFPLFLIWNLLFERQAFKKRGLYIYLFAGMISCSPYFIRQSIVFGNPFYVDEFASERYSGTEAVQIMKKFSVWDTWFDYRPKSPGQGPPSSLSLWERIQFSIWNGRAVVFGHHNGLSWYPGFFELLTPILTPFFLIGLWYSRGDPAKFMYTLFILLHLLVIISLKGSYEDRYLFPILPVCLVLSFYGLEKISTRFRRFSVINILALFILIEVVPFYSLRIIMTGDSHRKNQFAELTAICDWIETETPSDTVLMTFPWFSPQYFCNRQTIPLVYGDMKIVKSLVEEYGVDYLLFMTTWDGDRFPRFSFMKPLLRGSYFTLHKIDRNHHDFLNLSRRYNYLKDINLLDYFFAERIQSPDELSIFNGLCVLSKNKIAGGVLFVLLFICFLLLISKKRSNKPRYLGYPFVIIVVFILGIASAPKGVDMKISRPPISRLQAEHFFAISEKAEQIEIVHFVENGNQTALADSFIQIGSVRVGYDVSLDRLAANSEAIFIPIEESRFSIANLVDAQDASKSMEFENEKIQQAEDALKRLGYQSELFAGGVLGIPPLRKEAP